jgi:DNA polymerase
LITNEDVIEAENTAINCNTVNKLELAVKNFNNCSLKSTSKNVVFADGNNKADLMVIGEAPGAEEDKIGLPFVGLAGKLLDRMLAAINYDRTNTYITNVIFWRPPGNRKPTDSEITLCYPFVKQHIILINPKVLVLSGVVAAQTILKSKLGITRLRGVWHKLQISDQINKIDTIPIFHPAFLLRQPERKRETWSDLKSIREKLTI